MICMYKKKLSRIGKIPIYIGNKHFQIVPTFKRKENELPNYTITLPTMRDSERNKKICHVQLFLFQNKTTTIVYLNVIF